MIYLTTGQMQRFGAGYTQVERRYFGTVNKWPNIDSTLWSAAWGTTVDPDTIGAPWIEITNIVYDYKTSFHEIDDGDIAKWSVDLAGHDWDARYIQENHGLLCMWRLYPDVENASGWSNWRVAWLGYIKSKHADGSASTEYPWTAIVEGNSQYADKKEAEPEILSRTDLCLNQPVTCSSLLQDMRLEAGKGEFLGVPENNAQNLTDGDDAVPVISENEPSLDAEEYGPDILTAACLRINEVYIRPPAGYGSGYQFIELVNMGPQTADATGYTLDFYDTDDVLTHTIRFPTTQSTGSGWVSSGSALAAAMYGEANVFPSNYNSIVAITNPENIGIGLELKIDNESMNAQSNQTSPMQFGRPNPDQWANHASGAGIQKRGDVSTTNPNLIPPKSFVIFAQNRRRLDELFTILGGIPVEDWQGQKGNETAALDTAQGTIILRNLNGDEIDRVTWGTGDGSAGTEWIGDRVPLPAVGWSIRRLYIGGGSRSDNGDNNAPGDWAAEDVPLPGRGKWALGDVFVSQVQLPSLTCQLERDLNDDDTTAYVNNTGGFYAAKEMNVQIVNSIVPYTGKTATTFTLTDAWAGGNVPAGTRLYPVDAQGVAHDSWPVGLIQWARKKEPLPVVYDFYVSEVEAPLGYNDDDWLTEWTPVAHVTASKGAKTTAEIGNGTLVVPIDNTDGWPERGTVIVIPPTLWPEPPPVGGYQPVKFLGKTKTSITLEVAWNQGVLPAKSGIAPQEMNGLTWTRAINPVRAKHLMMLVYQMSDGGRGKLNRISSYPEMAATTNPSNQVDGADWGDFVGHLLTTRFGLPASKYSQATYDVTMPFISTQRAPFTTVLRDGNRRSGSVTRFQRADGIRQRPKPEHPYGAQSGIDDDVDWTFTNEYAVLVQATWGETRRTSQVRLKCMVSGTRDVWYAYYPAVPDEIGTIYQPQETIVVGTPLMGAQLAEVEYWKRSFPQSIRLSFRVPLSDWCAVTMRVNVSWPIDYAGYGDISGMYKIVTLDERISGSFPTAYWETVLGLERLHNA